MRQMTSLSLSGRGSGVWLRACALRTLSQLPLPGALASSIIPGIQTSRCSLRGSEHCPRTQLKPEGSQFQPPGWGLWGHPLPRLWPACSSGPWSRRLMLFVSRHWRLPILDSQPRFALVLPSRKVSLPYRGPLSRWSITPLPRGVRLSWV